MRSIPALAAAIRETYCRAWPTSSGDALREQPFTSFYAIQAKSEEAEARAAAHLVSEVAERLRRLGDAYGEWDPFDPAAYFDLTESQAAQLVHVTERINTVHIAFFMDPLLPSFYEAESFWANHFFPAYHAANSGRNSIQDSLLGSNRPNQGASDNGLSSSQNGSHQPGNNQPKRKHSRNGSSPDAEHTYSAFAAEYDEAIYPEMVRHWEQLLRVSQQTRRILADHIGYLAVNGSQEERAAWREAWAKPSPVLEDGRDIAPDYRMLPTLSLSIEFPLPVYRQPGRQKRLRLNRQRRRSSDR